jgi:hypothetical protein
MTYSDHPTYWTVHAIGPDDVIHFATAGLALSYVNETLLSLGHMFPREHEFDPMIRLVISPPTAVVDSSVPAVSGDPE